MNNFFAYLQQLELMAFFSGYCLLYVTISVIAGNKDSKNNFKSNLLSVLPLSYALLSTLYLGLQLKNIYLSYSFGNVRIAIHHPYLMTWALFAILFWIPFFRKKEGLSLLHSLVFFFILVKDIFTQTGSSKDLDVLKNDMRIYTGSFLLNLAIFILMLLVYYFFSQKRRFRYR